MRIGRYADGKGGIYAGITPGHSCDWRVYLAAFDMKRDTTWVLAMAAGKDIEADGFTDFMLPNPVEAALLYANLKPLFPDLWHWTRTPYPADPKCVWVQTFGYGRQADARMTDGCRARYIRIEACE